MKKIYRCITPKLPTAKNALFRRDVDGNLRFVEWKKDAPRPERESGYMAGGPGDSGSPLFTCAMEDDWKKRHIQIGVYNRAAFLNNGMETTYSTDVKDKCRMIVSKLTGDVVRWLGKIWNLKASASKMSNPVKIVFLRMETDLDKDNKGYIGSKCFCCRYK